MKTSFNSIIYSVLKEKGINDKQLANFLADSLADNIFKSVKKNDIINVAFWLDQEADFVSKRFGEKEHSVSVKLKNVSNFLKSLLKDGKEL